MAVTYTPPVTIRVINAHFFEAGLKVNYVDYLEDTDRWSSFPDETIQLNFDICIENTVIPQTQRKAPETTKGPEEILPLAIFDDHCP